MDGHPEAVLLTGALRRLHTQWRLEVKVASPGRRTARWAPYEFSHQDTVRRDRLVCCLW